MCGGQYQNLIEGLKETLKSGSLEEMADKIHTLVDDKKQLEKQVAEMRQKIALAGSGISVDEEVKEINGVKVIGKILHDVPAKELKPMVDVLKQKIGSGVVGIFSSFEGKVSIVVGVTKDLTDRFNAVDIVKAASVIVEGNGGGGRSDMAQAGGSNPNKIPEAIAYLRGLLG